MDYTVGDYSYLVDDNTDEFFDESDVLTDCDEFKPGFLDEEDDELSEQATNAIDAQKTNNQFFI